MTTARVKELAWFSAALALATAVLVAAGLNETASPTHGAAITARP